MEPRKSHTPSDPFRLGVGLKTDEELSQLRRRRRYGKSLELYHRRQNNVRAHAHLSFTAYPPAAHPFALETNGRPYQRSQGSRRSFSPRSRFSYLSLLYIQRQTQIKIAIWASLGANFALCVIQRASLPKEMLSNSLVDTITQFTRLYLPYRSL